MDNNPATIQRPFPDTEITESQVPGLAPIQKANLSIVQFVLSRIADGWSDVNGIDDLCKMSMITFKALEKRNDVLMVPNGYQAPKGKESYLVNPIP
jgi:hypothetical protein